MARIKYFSDTAAGTVELVNVGLIDSAKFATMFPGVTGVRNGSDRFIGQAKGGDFTWLPATRSVTYMSFPSRHECDARCTGATGRIMRCECACGGKNHGKAA